MKSKEKAKERGGVAIAGIHVVVGVSECAMCKLKEKSHPTIRWDGIFPTKADITGN